MSRRDEIREQALKDLQRYEVLMLNGHFDFGNGFHGRVYLNPHRLFRYPSTIWQFAQDLLDVVPGDLLEKVEVVAGPVMGGALLAHLVAGLVDSRRSMTRPPTLFAPFIADPQAGHVLSPGYRREIADRRVLLVDDVRNTGQTLARCAALVREAGGTVVASAEIYDRMEAMIDAGAPNFALAEYRAPENHPADACPLCHAGIPVTAF